MTRVLDAVEHLVQRNSSFLRGPPDRYFARAMAPHGERNAFALQTVAQQSARELCAIDGLHARHLIELVEQLSFEPNIHLRPIANSHRSSTHPRCREAAPTSRVACSRASPMRGFDSRVDHDRSV